MVKKIRKRLAPGRALRVVDCAAVVALVIGVVAYTHFTPTATQTQINSQTAAVKKIAKPKPVVKPPAARPQVTPPPPPAQVSTAKPVSHTSVPTKVAASAKAEPVVTPSPSSSVSGLTPTAPVASPSSSPSAPPTTTTGYTSTNWSGYMATTGNYTSVSGAWTATAATGNGSTLSADSTWIGIGGVTSSDLIQVGTQNTISAGGQVSAGAFYELLPNVSQPVPGLTVAAGDAMSATIVETASGQWTITIIDKANGQSFTKNASYMSSGSSAEWIEEDPSFPSRRLIPLDKFGTATFSNGSTISNGSNLTMAGSNAQPITMVNRSGQPVATPSALGGSGVSFSVTQD